MDVLRRAVAWMARALAVAVTFATLMATFVVTGLTVSRPWSPLAFGAVALVPATLGTWLEWRRAPWRGPDRGAAWTVAWRWGGLTLMAGAVSLLLRGGAAGLPLGAALVLSAVMLGVGAARRWRGLDRPPGPVRAPRSEVPSLARPEIEVHEDALYVVRYPYAPSALAPGGIRLPPERISAVFGSWEPAVIVDGREVVFLPVAQRDALLAFAGRHGIERSGIPDAWALLTAPFIDQPYAPDEEARDGAELARLGFPPDEVRALRAEVRPMMLTATFYTFEWVSYSTDDVLRAYAVLSRGGLTAQRFRKVMDVALRPYRARGDGASRAVPG